MKQPEDTRTMELPGLDQPRQRAPRGPYAGRYNKGETTRMRARASTGLTMAEFAARAGVSERTLRNWEGGVGKTSLDVLARIADTLRAAKVDGQAFAAAFPGQATKAAKPVRYRNRATGETWSGRGLMPRWLRVRLDEGHRLAEYEA